MIKLGLLGALLLWTSMGFAQSETQLTYSGRLYDAAGVLYPSKTIKTRIEVRANASCYLFRRDVDTITDGDGNFRADLQTGVGETFSSGDLQDLLGTTRTSSLQCYNNAGNPSGSFIPSSSSTKSREVVISVSTDGGTLFDEVDVHVLRPYYQAQDSNRLGGKAASAYLTNGAVSQSALDGFFSGANFGSLSSYVAGGALSTSTMPTAPSDVTNKAYTDSRIAGQATSGLGSLTAGATGYVLTWNGSSWTAGPASTADNTKLPLAGGTLTGDLFGTSASLSGSLAVSRIYGNQYLTQNPNGYLLLSNRSSGPGLDPSYKGAMWFNSVSDHIELLNSSGTVGVLTDVSGLNADRITSGTLLAGRGGTGFGSYTPYAMLSANMTGSALEQRTCAIGEVLEWQGASGFACVGRRSGVVTNVGLNVPSFLNVTGSSISTAGTFDISLSSQNKGLVFASPTGAPGTPSFRSLTGYDLPIVAGSGVTLAMNSGSLEVSASGASGSVTSITAATGLTGGTITNTGVIAVDVGITAGKIVGVISGDKIASSLVPNLDTSILTTGILNVQRGGTGLTPTVGNSNQFYGINAAGTAAEFKTLVAGSGVSLAHSTGALTISSVSSGGTVTMVGASVPSYMTVAPTGITGAGTFDFSFKSQAAAQVFAAPTAANGVPSFRALTGTDLPVLAGTGVNVSLTGGSLQISADVGLSNGKIVAVGTGDKIPVVLIPNLPTSILTSGILGVNRGGTGVDASTAGNGQLLIGNGSGGFALNTLTGGTGISILNTAGGISISSTLGGGTVTNVGLSAPTSVFTVTNSPVTGAGVIDLSLKTQAAAQVFAAPTGGSGIPSFRALAGTDLPVLAGTGVSVSITSGSLQISAAGSGGTVTSVTASTGLLGGTITGLGTVSVDVGLTNGKIVAVGTGDKIPVALIPNLSTDVLTSGTLGVNRGGTGLAPIVADANRLYGINAAGTGSEFKNLVAGTGILVSHSSGVISISSTLGGGTVTNIGAKVPTYMSVSPATVTSSGTFDIGFNTQAAATVFAAPTGASGAPSFRALAASDLPGIDASKIVGILGVDRGGTGIGTITPNALLMANPTGSAVVSAICSPEQIMVWKLVGGWTCENKTLGSVSRVDLTVPASIFTVVGGPVTSNGTFDVTLQTQAKNTVFAAPTGGTGAPTFRSLAAVDIPNLDTTKLTSGILPTSLGGTGLVPTVGNANQFYAINPAGSGSEFKTIMAGTGVALMTGAGSLVISAAGSGGTVTNVGLAVPSYMAVTPASVSTVGTFALSYSSQSARNVFAAPTGAAGAPIFRALEAGDIAAGVLSVNRGGTGIDASTAANGQILIGNGLGFTLGNLTASTGITINNAAGAVSISSSIAETQWSNFVGGIHYSLGSVGIGKSNPTYLLDVNGAIGFNGTLAISSGASTGVLIRTPTASSVSLGLGAMAAATGPYNTAVGVQALNSLGNSTGNTAVGYGAGRSVTSGNNTMVGTEAGRSVTLGSDNILIGANAANTLTTGSSNIIIGGILTSSVSASNELNIGGLVRGSTTAGNQSVSLYTAGTERMMINSGGSIGIGTSSPTEKLEVAGVVKALSFTSISDGRLKKDIEPIAGMDAIQKLRGVQYRWISNDEADAGVIAQEVERVFPAAVRTDAKGMKSVKYNYLIAPLIEAVKELDLRCEMQVSELHERIDKLEEQNAQLLKDKQLMEERLLRLERAAGLAP